MTPGAPNSLFLLAGSAASGGQEAFSVDHSLRLRSSASAYLTDSYPASNPTSEQLATLSCWLKFGAKSLGIGTVETHIFSSNNFNGGATQSIFRIKDRHFEFGNFSGTLGDAQWTSTTISNPGKWYHVVLSLDFSQSIGNRATLSVDGSILPKTLDTLSGSSHGLALAEMVAFIGGHYSAVNYDGYLAEMRFIDGQALPATAFGEMIGSTWIPKAYAGTYGVRGFYLPFNDGSSSSEIGKDRQNGMNNSGPNGWTANGVDLSIAQNRSYDWMLDTPTHNYAVLDSELPQNSGQQSYSTAEGNLVMRAYGPPYWVQVPSTIGKTSGKYQAEFEVLTNDLANTAWSGPPYLGGVGVVNETTNYALFGSGGYTTLWGYTSAGYIARHGVITNSSYSPAGWVVGDIIGILLDMNAKTVAFSKNGVSYGIAFSDLIGTCKIAIGGYGSELAANFGQRPFTYPQFGFGPLINN